jgi:hypothetical protein|tara:strand:- start:107 stop:520 length:414 start_codon:yes stop_codon:yes gene_type:complete
MSFSDYLEDKVLDHVFGGTAYTAPTTLYVGLFTSTASDSAAGTEVSGNGYARQTAAFTVSGTSPTTAASSANIEFPEATGSWGTITYAGIFDASSSGNMLAYAQLTDPSDFSTPLSKTVATGDVLRITAGNLKVTLN